MRRAMVCLVLPRVHVPGLLRDKRRCCHCTLEGGRSLSRNSEAGELARFLAKLASFSPTAHTTTELLGTFGQLVILAMFFCSSLL